ncbi:phosphate-starvation-inducible PsiE family protein [Pyrobaculum sp. 3827-6]|uniref:phosphate-starvation-inducible PsiE family protein n=1 Tax=Pyrobaculum sp. 3827-6 TaxID=2983604 RepID=UPI0021D8CE11|nr:phosphate-starvation-inducible PsiE family protein [Pyrobaculum sp. 3827-6]MCU7787062.1 phosphate-starvation-inducible PsiE family protein [Pyrobaculum sp. 3827-6]
MNIVEALRRGEYLVYLLILLLTLFLLVLSLYMAFSRVYDLFQNISTPPDHLAISIYNVLSDIFLVVVFVELIDTFITYIEQKRIVVYKIIDVALVALARELFIYLAPVNKEFSIDKAVALVGAAFVVGVIDYLQRRALPVERRRRA